MSIVTRHPPIVEDEETSDNPVPMEQRTPWAQVVKVLKQNTPIIDHKFNWDAYEQFLKAHGWTILTAKAKLRLPDDKTVY